MPYAEVLSKYFICRPHAVMPVVVENVPELEYQIMPESMNDMCQITSEIVKFKFGQTVCTKSSQNIRPLIW